MPRPKITFDSDSEDSDSETTTPIFLTTSTVFQQRRPSLLEKLKQANENLSKGKNLQLSVGIGSPYWWRNKTLSERPILPSGENFKYFVAFKVNFSLFIHMKYLKVFKLIS